MARMGFSLVFGAYLIREWTHRRVLYGDRSPLSIELAQQFLSQRHGFTMFTWSTSRWWFESLYMAAIVVSVLLFLGWHTRTMSVLFMLMVLSVENRNMFVADGGDGVLHLMAIYLVLTRCGEVWSLDARRRRRMPGGSADTRLPRSVPGRSGPVLWVLSGGLLACAQLSGLSGGMLAWGAPTGWLSLHGWAAVLWTFWACAGLTYGFERLNRNRDLQAVLDGVGVMVHNCAMAVIAVEVCLIYSVAGWYKIQGPLWEDGTAVYYPLHLAYYSPWPALSHALTADSHVVFLITYGTVLLQVAFPFLVFNSRCKKALLAALMVEHTCMGVLLGLPFFSLAMIAADAVFLPTRSLLRAAEALSRLRKRLIRQKTQR
ncbi:HTTM domain-containing protein [Streptomyces afghaniensis]|nr:HTTM domain-containing protein [Streptomyces sp. HP-A2021]UOB12699.1 HTTM domain-containing protein [Streptomyces sp. HP-A2021]